MQLHLQTWEDVETYLKTKRGIIMPIGSTEQHGPNGLIGTDALTAEVIGRKLGETIGALVAPTISVGMAQHHLAFAGSMALRPTTLIAVVRDYVQSLARHGFDRFFFINGHGGNVATVTAAFSELYSETSFDRASNRPGIRCVLKNWYQMPGVSTLSRQLYGASEGSHATPSEVSVTWFAYPEAARPMTLDPPVAPTGSFTDALDYRRNFPDGRIGSNPGLSSGEHGGRIVAAAVKDLAAEYQAFVAS